MNVLFMIAGFLCITGGVMMLVFATSRMPVRPPAAPTGLPEELRTSTEFRVQKYAPQLAVYARLQMEPRFSAVSVETSENGKYLNLFGRVKTGADKWDARSVAWNAINSGGHSIGAVFNNIGSDEPDPMPGPDTNAADWTIVRGLSWTITRGLK